MEQWLLGFVDQFNGVEAYLLVFAILMACGFGLPIPEDITLILGGWFAFHQSSVDPFIMILVSMTGVLLGDSIIFLFGAKFGPRLLKKRFFARILNEEKLEYVQKKYREKGNRLIFAARFMPGLRAPIFFTSGTLKLPFRVFFFYDGLAALLSVPAIVYTTYLFGDEIEKVIGLVRSTEYGILALVGMIIGVGLFKWWKNKKALASSDSTASGGKAAMGILAVLTGAATLGTAPPASAAATREPKETNIEQPPASSVKARLKESSESSPLILSQAEIDEKVIGEFCNNIDKEVKKLRWNLPPCRELKYKQAGKSVKGWPLIYMDYGNPLAQNTTLIFSMVHPDEITPFYVAMKLITWLEENKASLEARRVIVAPLVNPDGFFLSRKTRTNARGVDLNRNFNTGDWDAKAINVWKKKYRANPRRNPGKAAESEPETVFQRKLILAYKPQKILSLHAPLGFMDYDGPNVLTLSKFPKQYVKECLKLRSRVKAVSGGFFPGSLGNFAGQEMGIPTLTLEMPTADPRRANKYWTQFQTGIRTVIDFEVPNYVFENNGVASEPVPAKKDPSGT